MKQFTFFLSTTLFIALIYSCGPSVKTGKTDTPTSGNIHITVDESYRPMMEAQIEMFEALYVKAKINATYVSEADAFKDLMGDSTRLIVVSRELTDNEMNYFTSKTIKPKTQHIANDGLAFIVNPNNPASKMLYTQIKDIFTGKLHSWKQISATKLDSIKVIFDNPGSGNIRMIKEEFKLGEELPKNCFAVNSNAEVVKFVESNPNSLGIISVNWISDASDSTAIDFQKKIKVLKISPIGTTDTSSTFYGPYQGYIANTSYPFIRKTYMINRESHSGLGTGFVSFVASDKGQRIILRSGMVPATAPVRLVNINTQ